MKIGSVVMFTDGTTSTRSGTYMLHSTYPEFFPPVKTIGTVTEFLSCSELAKVQWPSGTTSGNDSWWCHTEFLLEL